MNYHKILTIVIFSVLPLSVSSQPKFYADVGLSYIEHFSVGAGANLGNHSVGVIYGSDFFLHPNKFVNIFGQYQFAISRFNFLNFTPLMGIKGGHSVFSDHYYRWNVVSVAPYTGLQYQLTDQVDVYLQTGIVFSLEQSVTRMTFGEIGHYKEKLPELKIGMRFKPVKKKP